MKAEASVAHVFAAEETTRKSSTSGPIPDLVWAFCIHSGGSPDALAVDEPISFIPGRYSGRQRFRHEHQGPAVTDLDTAFLWALLLMVLSSFAAYLIMKRFGIIR